MKLLALFTSLVLLAGLCSPPGIDPAEGDHNVIRLNQLGYYPQSVKEFLAVDVESKSFLIMDETGKSRYKGRLTEAGSWEASGEKILKGDFTEFDWPGVYTLSIEGVQTTDTTAQRKVFLSHPFQIRPGLYAPALDTAIRSFYFQRASMPIEEAFGGIYSRAAGHPDISCPFHPSTGKSGGTLDSPGGWYDAGDYGKYIVNAAISVGQMLNLLEIYPEVIGDSTLNIPESGNGTSDLLDEIIYELDWMVTMQDADGGVFHKLTARNFGPFIMPSEYDLERLIIGKGTAATLGYAATLAQASRVLSATHPVWAEAAIYSAENAWKWAIENDNIPFRNPEDVHTGEYGDDYFGDDFYWAAAELYVTTGRQLYLEHLLASNEPYVHQITNSWKFFIRNMGFHSLLTHRQKLDPRLVNPLVLKHLELADGILQQIDAIPYAVGLDHFEWGSNSDVLNQAMILCVAHHLSGSRKYLDGVIRNVDYIFGKNATGYSFMTGMGSRQVMNPHHRPSGADGIEAPVPGFILGGPNDDRQDRQFVDYSSDRPAKAYEDVQDSYASNEVCLNWNAPAVFVLGYLESVMR